MEMPVMATRGPPKSLGLYDPLRVRERDRGRGKEKEEG